MESIMTRPRCRVGAHPLHPGCTSHTPHATKRRWPDRCPLLRRPNCAAWLDALEQLLASGQRQRVAAEGQAVLPANDMPSSGPRWESALEELVDRKRARTSVSVGETPVAWPCGGEPPEAIGDQRRSGGSLKALSLFGDIQRDESNLKRSQVDGFSVGVSARFVLLLHPERSRSTPHRPAAWQQHRSRRTPCRFLRQVRGAWQGFRPY